MKKWSYKVRLFQNINHTAEKELNTLGDEGWELIDIFFDTNENAYRLIFKRKTH